MMFSVLKKFRLFFLFSILFCTLPAHAWIANIGFYNGLRVTRISPTSGTTGTSVTVNGLGFKSGDTISIGGVNCTSSTFVSNNQMLCVVPALPSASSFDVVVKEAGPPKGTLSLAFTYAYDTDAQTYFSAIATNSGTISSTTRTAINNLVMGLKSDSIWTKLVEVYPFAGNQLAASLVKLKVYSGNAAVLSNSGFANTDFTETGTNAGLKGNNSKYLDTGYTDSTSTLSNVSIGVYRTGTASEAGGSVVAMGTLNGCAQVLMIRDVHYSDGNDFLAGSCNSNPTTYGDGLIMVTRTGTTTTGYVNGSSIFNNASASGAFAGVTIAVFAVHGGVAAVKSTINFAFIGTGFSAAEQTKLYNRILTYNTALTRN